MNERYRNELDLYQQLLGPEVIALVAVLGVTQFFRPRAVMNVPLPSSRRIGFSTTTSPHRSPQDEHFTEDTGV
jgi:hypothetical protein